MPELETKLSKRKIIGISIILIIALLALYSFAQKDINGMIKAMTRIDLKYVFLAVFLQSLFMLFWAKRWGWSLEMMGFKSKLKTLYAIIFGSKFINNVTPFSYAGGDAVTRAYLIRKIDNIPYSAGFASSIAEYVPDFIIFTILMISALIFSFGQFTKIEIMLSSFIAGTFVMFVFLVLKSITKKNRDSGKIEKIVSKILKLVGKPKPEKEVKKRVDKFSKSFREVFKNRRRAFKISFLSILIWISNILIFYILFFAFGINPPLPAILLTLTIPMFVGMIPITIGGLGTMDFARAGILLSFMPTHGFVIGNVVILRRLIGWLFTSIVGSCILSYLGFKIWKD